MSGMSLTIAVSVGNEMHLLCVYSVEVCNISAC